jgi:ABC-type antimicrobial peptide transport system permease subunit
VAQRSREIGVRTALGATSGQIAALVLRSGAAIVGLGLAAGLGAAASLVQLLSKILYGVRPFDPVTFAAVPAFLLLGATVACIGQARRAARIDPLRALRSN